jgi:hypothetical protein
MTLIEELRFLFAIFVTLDIPGARTLEPTKDAYKLWELTNGILEHPIVEERASRRDPNFPAVVRIELDRVFQVLLEMKPSERDSVRESILRYA